MHYCILVVTKEFPTDKVLGDALKPYRYDNCFDEDGKRTKLPPFTWGWFRIGGRYNGMLKLAIHEEDEKYKWENYVFPPRSGRLFRSFLLETVSEYEKKAHTIYPLVEEYFFRAMGSWDGYIRVDAATVDDIQNMDELGCFGYIDRDGNASARETWDGDTFVKNDKFDEQFKAVIADSSGCFVCVLDIHD